jgi:hypothetical protein
MSKKGSLRTDFARAVARLAEVLALPKSDTVRDAAIQRFPILF